MKSLAFLQEVGRKRKVAVYAAAHEGKMRNFAYLEGLGECRETFARLVEGVQGGEIGVILTHDAACLVIETSPGWMEEFIQAIKLQRVLIGDRSHDLLYDLCESDDETRFRGLFRSEEYEHARNAPRPLADALAQSPFAAATTEKGGDWFLVSRLEGRDPDASVYSLSSGERDRDVDLFALGHWKEILDVLAPYGITKEGGWRPVHAERMDWLSHTQKQEDAVAERTTAAIKQHQNFAPKETRVSVIPPDSGRIDGRQGRRRGGRRP